MPPREQSETDQVGLRMKEPLRAAIEEAARRRGVSLNAELVTRLERSLEQDQRIEDVFGSAELFGLMKAVASIMDMVGRQTAVDGARHAPAWEREHSWIDYPYAYDQAFRAACRVLEAARPRGLIEAPEVQVLHPPGESAEEQKRMNEEAATLIDALMADAVLRELAVHDAQVAGPATMVR